MHGRSPGLPDYLFFPRNVAEPFSEKRGSQLFLVIVQPGEAEAETVGHFLLMYRTRRWVSA